MLARCWLSPGSLSPRNGDEQVECQPHFEDPLKWLGQAEGPAITTFSP